MRVKRRYISECAVAQFDQSLFYSHTLRTDPEYLQNKMKIIMELHGYTE